MAGIYIPGMEMPAGCPFCICSHWNARSVFTGCNAVPGKTYAVVDDLEYRESPADIRPEWCPLVSVPDHGRLIDGDALIDELPGNLGIRGLEYLNRQESAIVSWIHGAPTIIPADNFGDVDKMVADKEWPEWRSQVLGQPYTADREGET